MEDIFQNWMIGSFSKNPPQINKDNQVRKGGQNKELVTLKFKKTYFDENGEIIPKKVVKTFLNLNSTLEEIEKKEAKLNKELEDLQAANSGYKNRLEKGIPLSPGHKFHHCWLEEGITSTLKSKEKVEKEIAKTKTDLETCKVKYGLNIK
jgi:hypothetical protein